jgi:hypothetical protein
VEVMFYEGDGRRLLHAGNADVQQRGSGHLAAPGWPSDTEPRSKPPSKRGTSSWVNQRGRGVCMSVLELRRDLGKAHEGKPRSEPDRGNPAVRDRRGLAESSCSMGAGLRSIGKSMESPPDPTVTCAAHFYPDPPSADQGSL